MIHIAELLELVRVNRLEAEQAVTLKWIREKSDDQLAISFLEELIAAVQGNYLTIEDVSLVATFALAGCTKHPRLNRAITVTEIPATADRSVSAYADCRSPFEPSPTPGTSGDSCLEQDEALVGMATRLVQVIETFYLANVTQADAHRRALAATVQGMQVLGHLLRAYAIALVEVLRVPGAGQRCLGFLQIAAEGLTHRPAALSVAHATLLHVARQANVPAAALRLVRPVLRQSNAAGVPTMPTVVDVDFRETGASLADYAAFYVEAGLLFAGHGLWLEATQSVYNVVTLHEGECFGSTWNGTGCEVDVDAERQRTRAPPRPHVNDTLLFCDDIGRDVKVSNVPDHSWQFEQVAARTRKQADTLGHALPVATRVAPIGPRDPWSTKSPNPDVRARAFCPTRVEVQLAYDLYVQAIKLCHVFLVIAYGGGQPDLVRRLVKDLDAHVRQAQQKIVFVQPGVRQEEAGVDDEVSPDQDPQSLDDTDRRGDPTDLGDPGQSAHSAADNADFCRSHMQVEKIVLAGTRLDAFTSLSAGSNKDGRAALQSLERYPATLALLKNLAPYRAMLLCAARRDLVGWDRAWRSHAAQLHAEAASSFFTVATSALRQHILLDLAHTYEAVYLRDVLLRITPPVSGSTTDPVEQTTARRADVNEVATALQLLRQMHEAGHIEFHLERPQAALDARDAGGYVVHLAMPPLTIPTLAGGRRPPHGYFCLAPPLHEVDLKPALVERTEYLQQLRGHAALVKEIDFVQWQATISQHR